jgi:molecular chaperone GrpE
MESKKKPPKSAELEAKIKELSEQIAKLTDIAGRAQADLQNAKIRLEKSREEMGKFAAEETLRRLLPVIDNFQRAFQHLPEDLKNHEWVKGIVAIEQDLMRHLGSMGLSRMESLGRPVDPSRHEILMTGEGEDGKVIEVFEEGFELHGRVLRPAKVKAGQSVAEQAPAV